MTIVIEIKKGVSPFLLALLSYFREKSQHQLQMVQFFHVLSDPRPSLFNDFDPYRTLGGAELYEKKAASEMGDRGP